MKLSGSYKNCTEDFLQFGRDVLFITTHLRSVATAKPFSIFSNNPTTSPLFANLTSTEVSTLHSAYKLYFLSNNSNV